MRTIGIIKQDRKRSFLEWEKLFFRVGKALLLLCLVLSIASANEASSNDTHNATPAPTSPPVCINTSTVNITANTSMVYVPFSPTDTWGAILLSFGAFLLLVVLGYYAKERGRLDMGEMRRAIAGTFVVGFTILTILCLKYV